MAAASDLMCCPCLIKILLERDYDTRQGQSVEGKEAGAEVETQMEGLLRLVGVCVIPRPARVVFWGVGYSKSLLKQCPS